MREFLHKLLINPEYFDTTHCSDWCYGILGVFNDPNAYNLKPWMNIRDLRDNTEVILLDDLTFETEVTPEKIGVICISTSASPNRQVRENPNKDEDLCLYILCFYDLLKRPDASSVIVPALSVYEDGMVICLEDDMSKPTEIRKEQ